MTLTIYVIEQFNTVCFLMAELLWMALAIYLYAIYRHKFLLLFVMSSAFTLLSALASLMAKNAVRIQLYWALMPFYNLSVVLYAFAVFTDIAAVVLAFSFFRNLHNARHRT